MNVDRLVDTDGMFFVYKEPKIIKNVDAQYQNTFRYYFYRRI